MAFQDLITAAQKYFPILQIRYKDQSTLMKFLSFVLFFDRGFKTQNATAVGSTIYFPSQHFTKLHPVSSAVIFLHELVKLCGVNDQEAYLSSLYVIWKLSQRMHFNPHLETEAEKFAGQLKKPWSSGDKIKSQLQEAVLQIKAGNRPYQGRIFDTLDDLISKV